MAVLHEVNLSSVAQEQNVDLIREFLNKIFWDWYFKNQTKPATTVRFWFIRKTIYVSDLYSVFVLLFGPPR